MAIESAKKASRSITVFQFCVWDMSQRPPRQVGYAHRGNWFWDASFTGTHGRNAYKESCDEHHTPPETPRMSLGEAFAIQIYTPAGPVVGVYQESVGWIVPEAIRMVEIKAKVVV
jgi:hypothetical protein